MENLSEILARAQTGNQEAISQLIDYYKEQNDEDKAAYWEDKKTLENYAGLTILSMLMNGLELLASQSMGAWDEVENNAKEIRKKAKELLEMYHRGDIYPNADNIHTAKKHLADAEYGLAVAAYMRDDDANKAFQILHAQEELPIKSAALLGVAAAGINKLDVAYKQLNQVIYDQEYAQADRANYFADEMIYAQAFHYMSAMYRIGLPGLVKQDLEHAMDILGAGIRVIKDVDCRKILVNELSKYKKKLFGGYKYVE